MVQQLTSFTALFCCKEPHDILIHSVCFCPYFRFSSSKTKLLNFRLWVYCVNPHVVSWNPWCIIYNIYIYMWWRCDYNSSITCLVCRAKPLCNSFAMRWLGRSSALRRMQLSKQWLLQKHRLSKRRGQFVFSWKVLGGGFYGGSKLACFAAFCMQMPSGADIGTKTFRSWGGLLTSIMKCQRSKQMRLTVWYILFLSISAKLWIWPWNMNELFNRCALPLLFFKAKCRHNMLRQLPRPNSKSKTWNDSESFQRLAHLVPFDFLETNESVFDMHNILHW